MKQECLFEHLWTWFPKNKSICMNCKKIIENRPDQGKELMDEIVYNVTQCLPDHGKRVMCFGHATFCCKEDMDEEAAWHEVTFTFDVGSYKLKKEIPLDPEESILQEYIIDEEWKIGPDFTDGQVIGVSKWKKIN